jgi:hypothetical protein
MEKRSLPPISIILLIVDNIIPIFGVLFFKWSIFSMLTLYFVETLIIILFTLLKLMKAHGLNRLFQSSKSMTSAFVTAGATAFAVLIHYVFLLVSGVMTGNIFSHDLDNILGIFLSAPGAVFSVIVILIHQVVSLIRFNTLRVTGAPENVPEVPTQSAAWNKTPFLDFYVSEVAIRMMAQQCLILMGFVIGFMKLGVGSIPGMIAVFFLMILKTLVELRVQGKSKTISSPLAAKNANSLQ